MAQYPMRNIHRCIHPERHRALNQLPEVLAGFTSSISIQHKREAFCSLSSIEAFLNRSCYVCR